MQDFLDLLKSGQGVVQPPGVGAILLSLAAAALLSLPIALIYMKTRKREEYTQSFVQALILISIIVATVMLIIGNNIARAFGLIGAVAIIRFRTKVKDPKDTTFLFLCIAIGMACGLRLYHVSILSTAFISGVLLLLWRARFGNPEGKQGNGILQVRLKDVEGGRRLLARCFEDEGIKWRVIRTSLESEGTVSAEYEVALKRTAPEALVQRLKELDEGNVISIEYRARK